MKPLSTKLDDGRIRCRVRITGEYRGVPFEYVDPDDFKGSQFIWPDGEPSRYWWTEGNMGCDCNRAEYVGTPVTHPELFKTEDELNAATDEVGDSKCGHQITIHKITPLDPSLPVLDLMEGK